MSDKKIRVGIVEAGGWAKYGHIPALKALKEFEILAVSSRKKETADKTAAEFNIPHAFGDAQELIDHPDVGLVAVVAPAPEHARLVKLAIAAGKDVYSEWPLSTNTADSEELLARAEAKGVKHIVGLQRRMGPSARYTRDLVKQGYVGRIRGVHMTVNVDAFPATMPSRRGDRHGRAVPSFGRLKFCEWGGAVRGRWRSADVKLGLKTIRAMHTEQVLLRVIQRRVHRRI